MNTKLEQLNKIAENFEKNGDFKSGQIVTQAMKIVAQQMSFDFQKPGVLSPDEVRREANSLLKEGKMLFEQKEGLETGFDFQEKTRQDAFPRWVAKVKEFADSEWDTVSEKHYLIRMGKAKLQNVLSSLVEIGGFSSRAAYRYYYEIEGALHEIVGSFVHRDSQPWNEEFPGGRDIKQEGLPGMESGSYWG